jgi:hypothetical protein
MDLFRLSKRLYVALLVVLVACQAPATASPTAMSIPPTIVRSPSMANASPTAPLTANVIAEWDMSMPEDIAFAFDSVWVPSHRSPNVTTRIDPASNKIIAAVTGTGQRAHAALAVGVSIWVTGESDDLSRIDPKTNMVVAKVPGAHTYIANGFDSLWATTTSDSLDRIDPITNKIIASIKLGDGSVDCNNDVLVTAAAVWVDHCDEGELIKIDPASNTIVSKTPYKQLIAAAEAQTSIPAGKGTDFIWRTLPSGLLRIDPNTVAGLTFLPLQFEQISDGWVTVTDNAVWLSGYGQIERVNVATNQIDATYKVHSGVTKVGIGFGSVWVAYEGAGLVQRLDLAP